MGYGLEKKNKSVGASVNFEKEIQNAEVIKVALSDLKEVEGMHNRLFQPDKDIQKLVKSIRDLKLKNYGIFNTGLLQPILLRRKEGGDLEIIFGNSRVKAFKELGEDKIPAKILTNISDDDVRHIRLAENTVRSDISVYDEVILYAEFIESRLNIKSKKEFFFCIERMKNLDRGILANETEEDHIRLEIIKSAFKEYGGNYNIYKLARNIDVLKLRDSIVEELKAGRITALGCAFALNKATKDDTVEEILKKNRVKKQKENEIKQLIAELEGQWSQPGFAEEYIDKIKSINRKFTKKKISSLKEDDKVEFHNEFTEIMTQLNELTKKYF